MSLTAAGAGLLVAGPAHAQTVATGSLKFSGDAGDYVTSGQSYSYSTSKGDALTVAASPTGSFVGISVTGYNGDMWALHFEAPGTVAPINGKPAVLAPGTYRAAHGYAINGNGPGLDLEGNGRGCNYVTSSFTIIDAIFGPQIHTVNGLQAYVQKFDATFVQHCETVTAAATGEVHISNPPAPPAAPTQPAAVGGGNAAVGNIGGNASSVSPLLLLGVGVLAWALVAGLSLAIGLGMPMRRPVTRTAPLMRSRGSRR